MGALSNVGFKDDNAACCERDSGGKFKFQHDTGKNLKFVHVFPNLSDPPAADGGGNDDDEDAEDEVTKPQSPQEILLSCSQPDFERFVGENLPTYAQRKRLLDILKERIVRVETIEAKMVKLETLSGEEQALFDDIGAEELRQKVKALNGAMQQMIEGGSLTSSEKSSLLEQFEKKDEALKSELAKSEAEGKSKKASALAQQREVLQKTMSTLKDSGVASLPPLRHGSELRKLHAKLANLARIEKASKGKYSLDELKQLGERPELEEAVAVLEARSRMWLEEDAVFRERLQSALKSGGKASGKGGAYGGSVHKASPASGGTGFKTVGSAGARPSKAKASAPSTRNAFGALGD
eukprot:TRINITY_DN7026_c0_g1_i2.p1 TRINITY_DN7026_c0_g1~~TRINITY_DN7026_c0_g1_i2.p1  ORF type:complete len:352 (-),score=90.85 TRINITY_DN7026_c0_g1_i2:192-1247(-)